MPDFMPRHRISDINGRVLTSSEIGQVLGMTPASARSMLRAMDLAKYICMKVGEMEEPPLLWDVNMPKPLVDFVIDRVAGAIKADPSWSWELFPFEDLYEADGNTLKPQFKGGV